MLYPELEATVNEAPDRVLDGGLAGYWRCVIKHNVDDSWTVSLYRNNTPQPDITLTAASLGDLVLLAYHEDGVDISKTKELPGPNNRVLSASLALTRNGIRRRLRESGVEPSQACVEEAVRHIKAVARQAAYGALVDFIGSRGGNNRG